MAQIWFNRIYAGTHFIADVPELWYKEVINLIESAYWATQITKEEYYSMMSLQEGLLEDSDALINEYMQ